MADDDFRSPHDRQQPQKRQQPQRIVARPWWIGARSLGSAVTLLIVWLALGTYRLVQTLHGNSTSLFGWPLVVVCGLLVLLFANAVVYFIREKQGKLGR